MLKTHFSDMEDFLIAQYKIPSKSGHPLHKGSPREGFVKDFLVNHLPENIAIGTGEIIDFNSAPNETRNQFDIILYKKNYPKIHYGNDINCFLIESVLATIEVKSTLDIKGTKQAIKAANAAKNLVPCSLGGITCGYVPPKVLNFVIAYDGPAQIRTTMEWINKIHSELDISVPNLSINFEERIQTPSPSIDGLFILKKGFIYFGNVPLNFSDERYINNLDKIKWLSCGNSDVNLLALFMLLTSANQNILSNCFNMNNYLKEMKITFNLEF